MIDIKIFTQLTAGSLDHWIRVLALKPKVIFPAMVRIYSSANLIKIVQNTIIIPFSYVFKTHKFLHCILIKHYLIFTFIFLLLSVSPSIILMRIRKIKQNKKLHAGLRKKIKNTELLRNSCA